MFKLTKDDLAKKSGAQLAALFQQASEALSDPAADQQAVQSLLAMIRTETACRSPHPR